MVHAPGELLSSTSHLSRVSYGLTHTQRRCRRPRPARRVRCKLSHPWTRLGLADRSNRGTGQLDYRELLGD